MTPPDNKDWTWVLRARCPECGLESATVTGADVPDLVRGYARRWADVLTRPDVAVRPAAEVWSPLEYACHVRDVCRVMQLRAELMLHEECPTFRNWDQDATAVAERYGEQDPVDVTRELTRACDDVAAVFGSVTGDEWQRPGLRSNGSAFTVETLAQYFVHDVVHHLHDVDG